jgi:hypothetical protein
MVSQPGRGNVVVEVVDVDVFVVVVVVGHSHVMPMRCISVTGRQSTFGSMPQSLC